MAISRQISERIAVVSPDSRLESKTGRMSNALMVSDRAAHDWYRFVLSFPPHLVRQYIDKFQVKPNQCGLDPFCGTGTTLVDCKKQGVQSVGLEAHPMAHFASVVKTDWTFNSDRLLTYARSIADAADIRIQDSLSRPRRATSRNLADQILDLPFESSKILLKGSISPRPLHKVLLLLEQIDKSKSKKTRQYSHLALAKALVASIGNVRFGPEIGVTKPKDDVEVVQCWLSLVTQIAADLSSLEHLRDAAVEVFLADSRDASAWLRPESIDFVITSPPYPNEKDYTRTTRLESVILGFVRNSQELRRLKNKLIRSNTRNVFVSDTDDQWVADNSTVSKIAADIEDRRSALGKTSGFERLYHRVAKLYFGGMARHLASLRPILKPGARLAYVVGDQASYLRIKIRTANVLSQIAESLGYRVESIDLFRTRYATATKENLNEEVLVLEWPGKGGDSDV